MISAGPSDVVFGARMVPGRRRRYADDRTKQGTPWAHVIPYNEEPPKVLACPGFITGARYECTVGEPRYLATRKAKTR